MKKLLVNMIIALAAACAVDLILLIFNVPPLVRGWLACTIYVFIFFTRKGSGLRLISESKLIDIDKKDTEC